MRTTSLFFFCSWFPRPGSDCDYAFCCCCCCCCCSSHNHQDSLWCTTPEIIATDNYHQQPRQQPDASFDKLTKIKVEPKSPAGALQQNDDDDDDDAAAKLAVRRSTRKRIATKRERSPSEDEATGNSSLSCKKKKRIRVVSVSIQSPP